MWGTYCTAAAFSCAIYQALYPPAKDVPKNKHRCCTSWKWTIVLFELSIISEWLITLFSWLFLRGQMLQLAGSQSRFVSVILMHSLPLLCLMIDYTYNQMPFIGTHAWLIFVVSLTYMIVNFVATKVSGVPIYEPITWDSPKGYIIPITFMFFSILLFFLCKQINNYKISRHNL